MTAAIPRPNGEPAGLPLPTGRAANRQAIAITVAMFALAAVAVIVTPDRGNSLLPSDPWVWFAIIVAFAGFEYLVFIVQFRREGIVFSLSEISVAVAAVYLAPLPALGARALGSGLVLIFFRNNRGIKLVFNVAVFSLELALFFPLLRWLHDVLGGTDASLLSAIVVTAWVLAPTMGVLTALVISRYEGDFFARVKSGIGATWWFYAINSALATMTVALALFHPALTLLAAIPIGALWFVMVTHGELVQQLRDLEATHGFSGRVGQSLALEDITASAVDETMRLMHATAVALVRFTDSGSTLVHSDGEMTVRVPTDVDDPAWSDVLDGRQATVLEPGDLNARGLRSGPMAPTTIIAPVTDDTGPIGALLILGQDSMALRFGNDARDRAQSLAEQLSSSLRKGILHERLEWEARHDALTNLPSRTLFEQHVKDVTTAGSSAVSAVMMLDLDRFKEVNDTLGHHAGDVVLVEFSQRMVDLLEPTDKLARLAGDEFAILCQRSSIDAVSDLAHRCVREVGQPVTIDGLEIVVNVSVGVAEVIEGDADPTQSIRRADIAMYNAKWQRTGVEFYRDEIDRRTPARLSMLGDLRAAIESDHLTVVYQPKLRLSSNAVVGLEALVRWEHPTRGKVPPSEFVRVAEDTGLIKQLTDLVLATGIGALAEFQRAGIDIGMSVNLSTHDLFDSRLPDRVRDYLDSHGVDPAKLTLEITESSLFVDAPRTRATIDGLYEVGLQMAVDDFGTGYSSLSYLRRLPVHELKIDQSFVARMLVDPQDEVIVRSTVDLGHNLGLQVVAEGVETDDVMDRLREIGCDIAQGYAIAAPILADEIVEWVSAHEPAAGTTG